MERLGIGAKSWRSTSSSAAGWPSRCRRISCRDIAHHFAGSGSAHAAPTRLSSGGGLWVGPCLRFRVCLLALPDGSILQ